jgi:cyanophycinase-like exopeptidase
MRLTHSALFAVLFLLFQSCGSQNTEMQEEEEQTPPQLEAVVSYFVGNANIDTTPEGGICLMGGRSEDDQAMRWFLRRAQGGDVLVMRASGSNGYQDYFYNELGVQLNSVETLLFRQKHLSNTIVQKIDQAEAIWFAGGDQGKYLDYWKDNTIEDALQRAVDRGVVIGGTSAGMAIMGEYIWDGSGIQTDFIDIALLRGIVTDTHYSERNRSERHRGFVQQINGRGIAADEYTAICINPDGTVLVFGDPAELDQAHFLDTDLDTHIISGDRTGSKRFDLIQWSPIE